QGLGEVRGGFGGGQGGADLAFLGEDRLFGLGGLEGEQIVFEHAEAVEAPGGVGQSLHVLLFEDAAGAQFVFPAGDESAIGGEVFRGQDDALSGEAVAQGVIAGTLLAFRRGGPWRAVHWRDWRRFGVEYS